MLLLLHTAFKCQKLFDRTPLIKYYSNDSVCTKLIIGKIKARMFSLICFKKIFHSSVGMMVICVRKKKSEKGPLWHNVNFWSVRPLLCLFSYGLSTYYLFSSLIFHIFFIFFSSSHKQALVRQLESVWLDLMFCFFFTEKKSHML